MNIDSPARKLGLKGMRNQNNKNTVTVTNKKLILAGGKSKSHLESPLNIIGVNN
jgi:hypothetical protein